MSETPSPFYVIDSHAQPLRLAGLMEEKQNEITSAQLWEKLEIKPEAINIALDFLKQQVGNNLQSLLYYDLKLEELLGQAQQASAASLQPKELIEKFQTSQDLFARILRDTRSILGWFKELHTRVKNGSITLDHAAIEHLKRVDELEQRMQKYLEANKTTIIDLEKNIAHLLGLSAGEGAEGKSDGDS